MDQQWYEYPQYRLRTRLNLNALSLELYCYRYWHDKSGLGKAGHFRKVVELLWGEKSPKHFVWHPWAEQANDVTHRYNFVAISGCGSSGKTDFGAIFALVSWLSDPMNTLVLVTSTGLKEARKRVWGSIVEYWQAAPGLPGKLLDSVGLIRTDDGSGIFSDKRGIALIAGERSHEREAVGKIIGAKNKRVVLVADELPDITPAIMEAAFSNLTTNPEFQILALGNFKSRYDPFGEFVRPKSGWNSITVESEEWETQNGYCLHWDGLKSPNILAGEDIWPIYNSKNLQRHKALYKETQAMFWRMCRSFEAPVGLDNAIYNEMDLTAGNAYDRDIIWEADPIKVSGLDPSFTNGGDRCVQWIASMGKDRTGHKVLLYDKRYLLRENVENKQQSRSFQIADQFRRNCEREGVKPEHAAVDATGPGVAFYEIVASTWSNQVLAVDFSGLPSQVQAGDYGHKTARELYDRRVSELWYSGVEFLKHGQLKGVDDELARELKARKYDTVKGADGDKIKVETKKAMKERLGFSPDLADAAFIVLDLCRSRLGFQPESGGRSSQNSWRQKLLKVDRIYRTEMQMA